MFVAYHCQHQIIEHYLVIHVVADPIPVICKETFELERYTADFLYMFIESLNITLYESTV